MFLDPVCFCLYDNFLTQRTVYNQPDPGEGGYFIISDMMVKWSIQRNFNWTEGNLFVDDISDRIPVAIFLSGADQLAPATLQEAYLSTHRDCKVQDFDTVLSLPCHQRGWKTRDLLSVTVFRGCQHGAWLVNPVQTYPVIVDAMQSLTER